VPTELDETQRARWRQIQKSEPNLNSPFFNPEFTMAAAADRPGARVAILEDAGQIVAFFPFEKDGRIGEPIGRQLSDFHAVIASPQTDWDVVQMMRACGLVLWEFKNLMAYQKPLVRYHQGMSRSPAIDLRQGYEHYRAERRAAGTEQIKKAENLARRLEKDVGPLRFEAHTPDPAMFSTVIQWKNRDFQRHHWGAGLDEKAVRLLERIHRAQGPEFAGVLSTLYAGDRLAAVHFGMRSDNCMHYWFPTYDPELAKCSPGILLLLRIIEQASRTGIQRIDLGAGEHLYKNRLGNLNIELARGYAHRPSLAAAYRNLRTGVSHLLGNTRLKKQAKKLAAWLGFP
jgi:CelD/BcsL family acetyltransferase involved in cellulose biosynthesis